MNWGWVLVGLVYPFAILTMIHQTKTIRELSRELSTLRLQAMAATIFANALAERGIQIKCDDCGNDMGPDQQIDILPRPEGGLYVGHSSHNRKHDWGLVDSD